MKDKAEVIIRVLLGLALIVFGLDKFFQFVPHGHEMTEELIAAYNGLLANKFIMPTVGIVEIISGLLLVSGRYLIVAFGAMIPIAYSILGFHIAVDIHGILPGLIVALLLGYLIWYRRSAISKILRSVDHV
ncbi:DoxX family membrane protein [Balneola sp. MJW-20]|uniref:DoxX family membrane protein n=1 Tax=Gracilimonas aurantiaca TaxID=3234185 RepID=UPI003466D909